MLTRTFQGKSELVSIAGWAPDEVLTSREIEAALMHSPFSRRMGIESRTGVKERRKCASTTSVADMAVAAADKAISQANINANDIDLLIYCGVCREFAEPATATLIQHRLGLEQSAAFDVSNACLGFIDGWFLADAMIAAGRSQLALIVTAEIGSQYLQLALEAIQRGEDPRKHFASLTLGDGAAAALLRAPDGEDTAVASMITGLRESHGKYASLCVIPAFNQPMISEPARLFDAAFERFEVNAKAVTQAAGWNIDQIDCVIPHQASLSTTNRGREILGLPWERVGMAVDMYGNMASAMVPFTLAQAIDNKKIRDGDKVLVTGFGSGLGIGFMTLQF